MSGAAWLVVVLVSALGLLLLLGCLWLSRTRTLSRRVGSFACRLVEDGGDGPGARGVGQYGAVTLYWWRRMSVMPRPARTWSRSSITVLDREMLPTVPGRPQALVARCRVVPSAGGAPREIRLHMSADTYAGFTSWLEATPSRVGKVI